MNSITTKKTFAMHPQLLWDVITKQAGTLGKALLEGVMNSVDAGATRVDLQIGATGFALSDDGRGFSGEQEVTDFFATFGTPHTEGDARFGRFRMGRGQMFSFARTTWASNRSVMDVDIKVHGLDFHYREVDAPEAQAGCKIVGAFYELLDARGLLTACAEVERNCLYLEIPLVINGEQVNKDPVKQKWTHETDEAWFNLRSGGATGIAVYQQGVFVETIPSHEFGLSGVVVTRIGHPLRVNFARNQVIRSCPLFKRIVGAVKVQSKKAVAARRDLDDSEREMVVSETMKSGFLADEHMSARVFMDATGRAWSARQISALVGSGKLIATPGGKVAYSVAVKGDRLADRMMQESRAFVFDRECFEALGGDSKHGFANRTWFVHGGSYRMGLGKREAEFVPLEVLAKDRDTGYALLEEGQLSVKERLVCEVVSVCSDTFLHEVDQALGIGRGDNWWEERRAVRIGVSETSDGWTDGEKYIALNREFIRHLDLACEDGFMRLALLVLHEYCHQEPSSTTHTHTPEFYRAFHDASFRGLPSFVSRALDCYRRKLRTQAKALNRKQKLELARAGEQRDLTAIVLPVAAKTSAP